MKLESLKGIRVKRGASYGHHIIILSNVQRRDEAVLMNFSVTGFRLICVKRDL